MLIWEAHCSALDMVRQYGPGTPEEQKQFYDWVIARGGFVHSDLNLFKMFPTGAEELLPPLTFRKESPSL